MKTHVYGIIFFIIIHTILTKKNTAVDKHAYQVQVHL